MSPAFRTIRGANLFRLGANESLIYPNIRAIFGCGPTVVSREKKGGGGTDTLTAGMNGYRITSMAITPPTG